MNEHACYCIVCVRTVWMCGCGYVDISVTVYTDSTYIQYVHTVYTYMYV